MNVLGSGVKGKEKFITLKKISNTWVPTNTDSAFHYAQKMLETARKERNEYYQTDAYELLASLYSTINDYDNAITYLDSARYYSMHKLKDDNSVIYYDIIIGSTYLSTGNYSDALEKFLDALDIAIKIKRYDKVVASYNNIGAVYYYLGDDKMALDYFLKSYEIRIEHGLTKNMAFSLNNIGAIYSKYHELDKALEYHSKALEISKKDGDKYNMLKALTNFGDDYGKQADYSRAISYYRKALTLSSELNDLENKANILSKLGNIYFKNGNRQKAIEMMKKALAISYDINYKYGITSFSNEFGEMYIKSDALKKAKPLLDTAFEVAQRINASQEIINALNILSNYYYRSGEMRKAYDFRVQYEHLRDSLKVAETNLRVANLKNGFELKRKLDEIKSKQNELDIEKEVSKQRLIIIYLTLIVGVLLLVLLTVTIRLYFRIKEKNKRISENRNQIAALLQNEKETNKIKNNLISMISHEFRTPMAIISSNVQMLREMGEQMDKKMKEESAGYIINAISNLTEMMNNFSVLDKKTLLTYHPALMNPEEHIVQLVNELNTLPEYSGRIVLEINSHCKEAEMDQSLIRHIVRNLLVNALKFSSKTVTLTLKSDDHSFYMTVADRGIGIPEAELTRIFDNFYRASNAENTKGTGVGITVVQRCVKMMGGDISINSQLGAGTTVAVTLPCRENR